MRMLSALVLLVAVAPAAVGQTRKAAPPDATKTAPAIASAQVGTNRHGAGATAAATRSPHAVEASVLGTAFRARQGGGEVVIQTSSEVVLEALGGGAAAASNTFVLRRCRILRSNDRRPLDTRFFDSPVTGVSVKERGPDVEIDVAVRGQSVATPRRERGPGRTWYWVLSFAPTTTSRKDASAGRATAAANP